MSRDALALVGTLEHRRLRAQRKADELDAERHRAILAAIDAGESLTAIAAVLGVTRQALSKYLTRRENHDTPA